MIHSNQEVQLGFGEEVELEGGRESSGIVRVGNTVRRPVHQNAKFVRALLEHFERVGFDGAPRYLGIDDHGREILSYIDGQVFAGPEHVGDPVLILSDAKRSSAARLIRRFHDATAGTSLTGNEEVVCHRPADPPTRHAADFTAPRARERRPPSGSVTVGA